MKQKPLLIWKNTSIIEYRLWKMLHTRTGASMPEYRDTFERRSLVCGLEWDRLAARARAYEMFVELRGSGRTVILLGNSVREAFHFVLQNEVHGSTNGLPPVLVHPQVIGGCTWRQVPHPSGRNLWFNDAANVKLVELLMEELYNEYRKETV